MKSTYRISGLKKCAGMNSVVFTKIQKKNKKKLMQLIKGTGTNCGTGCIEQACMPTKVFLNQGLPFFDSKYILNTKFKIFALLIVC